MKLYEITEEIEQAAQALEAALEWEPDTNADGKPIDSEGDIIDDVPAYRAELVAAWSDMLEGAGLAFEDKVGNIAAYLKALKAEADALKTEEQAIAKRRKTKERACERLKEYVMNQMAQEGVKKVDHVLALVSLKNNGESVHISDEAAVIQWAQEHHDECLKYAAPEIRKTAVRELIKSGTEVPGAEITRTQSLMIK